MRRVIALILLLAAAGCKRPGAPQPVGGANTGGKRAFPVEVRKVMTEDVRYTIDAVGTLEPEEQVRVTARVAGMVEEVMLEAGARVPTKPVLAEIDRRRHQTAA